MNLNCKEQNNKNILLFVETTIKSKILRYEISLKVLQTKLETCTCGFCEEQISHDNLIRLKDEIHYIILIIGELKGLLELCKSELFVEQTISKTKEDE